MIVFGNTFGLKIQNTAEYKFLNTKKINEQNYCSVIQKQPRASGSASDTEIRLLLHAPHPNTLFHHMNC